MTIRIESDDGDDDDSLNHPFMMDTNKHPAFVRTVLQVTPKKSNLVSTTSATTNNLASVSKCNNKSSSSSSPSNTHHIVSIITIPPGKGPLGIHVVPFVDPEEDAESENGLLIEVIEPGGRIDQDGQVKPNDRIIEINGHSLLNVNFVCAQQIFKSVLKDEQQIILKIIPSAATLNGDDQSTDYFGNEVSMSPAGHSNIERLVTINGTITNFTNSVNHVNHQHSSSLSSSSSSTSDKQQQQQSQQMVTTSSQHKVNLENNSVNVNQSSPSNVLLNSSSNNNPFLPINSSNNNCSTKNHEPSSSTPDRQRRTPTKSAINVTPTGKKIFPGSSKQSKKLPGGIASLKQGGTATALVSANTRKIGKQYNVTLIKSHAGLGFSITTRDNPAGGNCPIYIKNILPKGPAVNDKRLKQGDRLLEVNGIQMTGKSQEEAVELMKRIPVGSAVDLVVSRQESSVDPLLCPSPRAPRPIPPEKLVDPVIGIALPPSPGECEVSSTLLLGDGSSPLPPPANFSSGPDDGKDGRRSSMKSVGSGRFVHHHQEVAFEQLEIPLNDTGSAGLGVSVMGKRSNPAAKQSKGGEDGQRGEGNKSGEESEVKDLGLFVKSVFRGGAAQKDGRLRPHDQLISINGKSLVGLKNSEAMETLAKTMLEYKLPEAGDQKKGGDKEPSIHVKKGVITLEVARRVPCYGGPGCSNNLPAGGTTVTMTGTLSPSSYQLSIPETTSLMGGAGSKSISGKKSLNYGCQEVSQEGGESIKEGVTCTTNRGRSHERRKEVSFAAGHREEDDEEEEEEGPSLDSNSLGSTPGGTGQQLTITSAPLSDDSGTSSHHQRNSSVISTVSGDFYGDEQLLTNSSRNSSFGKAGGSSGLSFGLSPLIPLSTSTTSTRIDTFTMNTSTSSANHNSNNNNNHNNNSSLSFISSASVFLPPYTSKADKKNMNSEDDDDEDDENSSLESSHDRTVILKSQDVPSAAAVTTTSASGAAKVVSSVGRRQSREDIEEEGFIDDTSEEERERDEERKRRRKSTDGDGDDQNQSVAVVIERQSSPGKRTSSSNETSYFGRNKNLQPLTKSGNNDDNNSMIDRLMRENTSNNSCSSNRMMETGSSARGQSTNQGVGNHVDAATAENNNKRRERERERREKQLIQVRSSGTLNEHQRTDDVGDPIFVTSFKDPFPPSSASASRSSFGSSSFGRSSSASPTKFSTPSITKVKVQDIVSQFEGLKLYMDPNEEPTNYDMSTNGHLVKSQSMINRDVNNEGCSDNEEEPDESVFQRDGFGRQSMSEKRHAHLDAKNTGTYQRTKKVREEREGGGGAVGGASDGVTTSGRADVAGNDSHHNHHHHLDMFRRESPEIVSHNYSSSLNRRRATGRSSGRAPLTSTVADEYGNILQSLRPRAKSVAAVTHPKEVEQLIADGPRFVPARRVGPSGQQFNVHASPDNDCCCFQKVPAPNGTVPATPLSTYHMIQQQQYQQQTHNFVEAGLDGGFNPRAVQQPMTQQRPSAAGISLHSQQTGLSITTATTTTSTATSTDDDMVNLCPVKDGVNVGGGGKGGKEKSKAGLFKKLFKPFGSTKSKAPQPPPPTVQQIIEELEGEAERIRAKRTAQLEQERIHDHYRRLKEQQQQQQANGHVNGQQQQQQPMMDNMNRSTTVAQMHHQQQQQQHPTATMRLPGTMGQTQVIDSQQEQLMMAEADKYGHYMNLKQIQELKQEFAARMKLQQQQQSASGMYQTMASNIPRPLPPTNASLMAGGSMSGVIPPPPIRQQQQLSQVHLRSMSQPGVPKMPRPVSNYYEYEGLNPTAIYEQRFVQHQRMMQQERQAAVQRYQRSVSGQGGQMAPSQQQQMQQQVVNPMMTQIRPVNQIIHDGNGGHYGVIAGPNGVPMAVPVNLSAATGSEQQQGMFHRQLSGHNHHRVAPMSTGPIPMQMMNPPQLSSAALLPQQQQQFMSSSSGLPVNQQQQQQKQFQPQGSNIQQQHFQPQMQQMQNPNQRYQQQQQVVPPGMMSIQQPVYQSSNVYVYSSSNHPHPSNGGTSTVTTTSNGINTNNSNNSIGSYV